MSGNCLSVDNLQRLHAGELAEADADRVSGHLRECAKCAGRENALRARHEAVLGHLREMAGDPLAPVLVPTETVEDAAANSDKPALRIEGYEVVRTLSHGGQGIVYQAIQHGTNRKVAIKVLLDGAYASPSARRRFEREIELVASLKHPDIVPVFHSGVTADGRQFCVMDYVRGVPLNQYVREKKLTLEEALVLFSRICDAVQYAHQRGVIHRDLKPSNILVQEATERGDGVTSGKGDEPASGEPQILDFGLAKMVGGPEHTLVSLTGQIVGTLPYMSPEQARGNPDEIDTRTDVYALGVILYELLTGQYPYPVVGQMADVLKHIAETEPTSPSRAWKPDSGVASTPRGGRGSGVASAPRGGRGRESAPGGKTAPLRSGRCPIDDEVQTISLKALAKERHRRYQSAAELARDIDRYLADEPIEAKRDSGWYVLKKAVHRHRLPVTVAVAFVALLTVAAMVSTVLLQRAEHEASRAAHIQSFLKRLLGSRDGLIAERRRLTFEQVLQKAADDVDAEFGDDPTSQAEVRTIIGDSFQSIGDYDRAVKQFQRVHKLSQQHFGEISPQVAESLDRLGAIYHLIGNHSLAERDLLAARQIRTTLRRAQTTGSTVTLGWCFHNQGDFNEAARCFEEALAAPDARGDLRTQTSATVGLGLTLYYFGDYQQAERLLRDSVTLRRQSTDKSDLPFALNSLGVLLKEGGRFREADILFREARQLARQSFGENHPQEEYSLLNLAALRFASGETSEGRALAQEHLELRIQTMPVEFSFLATLLKQLVNLVRGGANDATLEFIVQALLSGSRNQQFYRNPNITTAIDNVGQYLIAQNAIRPGILILRDTVEQRDKRFGEHHLAFPFVVTSLSMAA